jgi:2-dehydro-3-deoxyphosphogluconate aldolase/(4S)-4-hydroxy-2-oxoglutarate aldolase
MLIAESPGSQNPESEVEPMPWPKARSLARIREVGVVPIVRAPSPEDALRAAEAIIAGNIGIAEITLTVPNALRVMEKVVEKFGDQVLLGAGTILDPESCRAALLAGAEFIVTPSLNLHVVEVARRYGKPCLPGALTPTEIVAAWQAGADLVKVFPCGPVGGPKYIKALKGPFPQIELVPTGSVNLETTPEFIKAGAAAVAVGGELVDLKALREGRLDVISANARQYVEAVRAARASLGK